MFPELELKEGWATVALLLLMLLLMSWSIQAARWTDGTGILQAVVLVGGVTGIVLGKSRTPSLMAHALSVLAGLSWAGSLTGTVVGTSLGLGDQQAALELVRRFESWLAALAAGQASSGNIVFLLLLSLLLWIVGYLSAWTIFRWQRAWWAVILCSVVVLVNMTYSGPDLTPFLIGFLLVALLLVVRTSVAWYQQEWRLGNVAYGGELAGVFLRAGLAISVVTVLLAWAAPEALASRPLRTFWDKIGEPWRRLQDESSRIFQGLNYQNEPEVFYLTHTMRFGGAVDLTDKPILSIKASDGRYWRRQVFHAYTGDGWNGTDYEVTKVEAGSPRLAGPPFALRTEVTQTVTLQEPVGSGGTLTAAGQPQRFAMPVQAVMSFVVLEERKDLAGEGSVQVEVPGDPSAFSPLVALDAGSSYQVVSSLSDADDVALRGAGTDYPRWVVPRYLDLPAAVPSRVLALAEEIAGDEPTPFDKAVAVQNYLRRLPYNDQIKAPQDGRDGVDYFLFDVRQGYCTYYASSMVVMLRSLGVPARYVEGFSQGEREDGVFLIREWDGHSWPEVFFPGFGWVEFEPTAGEDAPDLTRHPTPVPGSQRPSPDRPQLQFEMDEMEEGLRPNAYRAASSVKQPLWQRIGPAGWTALGLLTVMVLLSAMMVVRRRRQIRGLTASERVYQDLVHWVRRLLRIAPEDHQTPHEYAGVVAVAVPSGQPQINRIADLYVLERFGGKTVPDADVDGTWRAAWPLLLRQWIGRNADRITGPWRRASSRPRSG